MLYLCFTDYTVDFNLPLKILKNLINILKRMKQTIRIEFIIIIKIVFYLTIFYSPAQYY